MTDGNSNSLTRLAENEVRFRDANERVGATARRLEIEEALPFICECGRTECTTVIRVLPADYERVRACPTRFLYAAAHDRGMPESRRVETLEHAIVVEKDGIPAQIAEAADPRLRERA
jgi:hypothetical protein